MATRLTLNGTNDKSRFQHLQAHTQPLTTQHDVCGIEELPLSLADRGINTATGGQNQPNLYRDPRPRGYSTSNSQAARPAPSFGSVSALHAESSRTAGMRTALGSARGQ